MIDSLEMYILIFFTYSFLGWAMESVGGILKEKKFINRGFLIGPYCPVYGTGIVLITFLLNKYTDDIPVVFFLSILICGTLEYATGYFMEKIFNARWWDYSKNKFNINGRVCLETLIPFGIAGTIILCFINPVLVNFYTKLPELVLKIIAYILSIIYTIDMIISFKIIWSFKKEIYEQKDNTEEISNMVKDKTEDILMKAESDMITFTRRLRLKELKMQRKLHYTSKKMYYDLDIDKKISDSRKLMNEKLQINKMKINEKIKEAKEIINLKQKESKENIEEKIEHIKISSEEFTKQIKEKFKQKSLLKSRLIDAFPSLRIEDKFKDKK